MTEKDILFKDLNKTELSEKPQEEIAHFGWEGNGAFAFMCNADAYYYAAETLYEKMRSVGKNYAILDGHIYPLVFMYRHFIELYIKGLYIKYSDAKEEDIKEFLNQVGHDLNSSWSKVKPLLSAGKKHVGSKQNIGAIEHYIKEMNKFDSTSMTMRYPITKDLDKQHQKPVHLDFVNLHNRMVELYNALHQLDYDIDNQIKAFASEKEMADFLSHYKELKPLLKRYISAIDEEIKREKEDDETGKSVHERLLAHIRDNREKNLRRQQGEEVPDDYQWLYENSGDDFKILVETLFYSGRHVRERLANLALSPNDRQKEFVSLCILQLKREGMQFGSPVYEYQTNVFSKSADAIKQNINIAISLLPSVPETKE